MNECSRARRRLAGLLQEWCSVYGADLPALDREAFVDAPPPRAEGLAGLAQEIEACRACGLGHVRLRSVPGEGPAGAQIMLIGGGPGQEDERTGLPFQGEQGVLLTRMLENGMGVPREQAFLTSVVKCRPPGGRDPEAGEARACTVFLTRQLEVVRPKVILALGRVAASALLGKAVPLPVLRGQVFRYQGLPLVVTWDLAYLLRHPVAKQEAWQDLKLVMKVAGVPIPGASRKKGDSLR